LLELSNIDRPLSFNESIKAKKDCDVGRENCDLAKDRLEEC
jgi:hypothetical protein